MWFFLLGVVGEGFFSKEMQFLYFYLRGKKGRSKVKEMDNKCHKK
jgi:hypothetical protein